MGNIKEEFERNQSWGLLTSLDLFCCDPEIIRKEEDIKQYVRELCNLIEMNRFGETQIVHFGEDENIAGYSMTQLIETSLISGHFANKTNSAYIDIFSCKYYDPLKAADFSKNFFKARKIKISHLLRGENV